MYTSSGIYTVQQYVECTVVCTMYSGIQSVQWYVHYTVMLGEYSGVYYVQPYYSAYRGLQCKDVYNEKKYIVFKVIFKMRGKTLEIKDHKKWKYDDNLCVGCSTHIETEKNYFHFLVIVKKMKKLMKTYPTMWCLVTV